ncbi:hypothetical protein KJ633_04315 [bacterium]|nr:hypothetical protein [bacterium]MBU3955664.1 hypothetical protein [bacterium]
MKPLEKKYAVITVFAVAMAFMEAAVVVYLRALYYPGGFAFSLAVLPRNIFLIEIAREAATIIMLGAAALLASRKFYGRFAVFLYAFAVWDIFYYVFLKALLGWPGSFFEMDVLFLIPVVWRGPVLAPLICSLTMLVLGAMIERGRAAAENFRLSAAEWGLLWAGAIIIFISFTLPIYDLAGNGVLNSDSPPLYNWRPFLGGEFLILLALFILSKRRVKNWSGSGEIC